MSSNHVTVKRIYNNNVILGTAADGSEIVLVGKGLGYAVGVGGTIDSAHADIRRFVPDQNYRAAHVAQLLSDASVEEANVAQEIVEIAADALEVAPSQRLLLPVLDHLSFAVQRAKEGSVIDFPLRWEVAQAFPREAELGRRALEIVHARLGVTLQPDEWSAFALHFVTYQWSGGSLPQAMSMADAVSRAFDLLSNEWGHRIDQSSMSASRFVTHLRYLWARVLDGKQLAASPIGIMSSVSASYPQAASAAIKLAALVSDALQTALTSEEVAYLALHTSRLHLDLTDADWA